MGRGGWPLGRIARAMGFSCGVALACVGLALVVVAIPAGRERLARVLVHRLKGVAWGPLTVGHIAWPGLGHLRLRDIVCTHDGDTLLVCPRLEVRVDLLGLLRRDLHLHDLQVERLRADVPALARRARPTRARPARRASFPREGSFHLLPSVGVDRFALSCEGVKLSDSLLVAEATLEGGLENRAGRPSRFVLSECRVRTRSPSLSSTAGLQIDVGRGIYHGSASVGLPWGEFALRLEGGPGDSASLSLVHEDGGAEPWGLWAMCTLERDEVGFTGLGYRGRLCLPASDELASVSPAVGTPPLPTVPRTDLAVEGFVRWDAGLQGRLVLEALPHEVVREALLRAGIRGHEVRVDTVALALPGVRLDARGTLRDSLVYGEAALCVTDASAAAAWGGAPWLRGLEGARASLKVAGPLGSPALQCSLEAGGRIGEVPIGAMRVHLSTPAAGSAPAELRVRGSVGGGPIKARALVGFHDRTLRAQVHPLVVWLSGPSPGGLAPGQVRADLRDGSFEFSDLLVVSDYGRLWVAGTLGPSTDNVVVARIDWPSAPPPLTELQTPHARASGELEALWRAMGPFFLELRVEGGIAPQAERTVHGSMRLPGPSLFAAGVPGAELSSLGPLEGVFEARIDPSALVDARMTLRAEGWLDTSTVRLRHTGDATIVDTLDLSLSVGHVGASGSLVGPWPPLRVRCEVPELAALRSVLPTMPSDLEGSVWVEGCSEGPSAAWPLLARAEATVRSPHLRVPRLELDARWCPDSLWGALHAPEGLSFCDLNIGEAIVRYSGSGRGATGALTVLTHGDLEALLKARLVTERRSWRIGVDTLEVRVANEGVAASPFAVTFDPSGPTLTVEGLLLGGTFGSLTAEGVLSPGGSRFHARLVASIPARVGPVDVPFALQGSSLGVDVRVSGRDSLEGTWRLESLNTPIDAASGSVRAGSWGFSADGVARQAGREVVGVVVSTPLACTPWPPRFAWADEPLYGALTVTGLLVPLNDPEVSPLPMVARGRLTLEGSLGAPQVRVEGMVEVPRRTRQPARSVILRGELLPVARTRGAPVGAHRDLAGTVSALRGSLLAVVGRDTVLSAFGRSTVGLCTLPFSLGLPDTATVDVVLDAPRFPLGAFGSFLPARTEVSGELDARLRVWGSVTSPTIAGSIQGNSLRVRTADGSRGIAHLEVSATGPLRTMRIRGAVGVINGIIALPEAPRAVHDAQGDALVWSVRPPQGTSAVHPEPIGGASRPATGPTVVPDVEVDLRVPGGLWVRGQGLDVEVAGDLHVAYRTGPVLTGNLRTVRGRFDYLGRTFNLRRGMVIFYGKDPPDPVIDIVAEAKVADATFTITLGGTLREPRILLDSSPPMPEANIVSYLLLGRPVERLTSGQLDLVRDRLTEIASLQGAGQLQAAVSKALGLDVIKVGEGSTGSSEALVIGKYLSPRLLVGYERGLSSGSPTYVTLEYLISEVLRLKTWTGHGGESSVELSFQKDY